ncbi:exportin ellipsoid body open [Lycorma delicatula]|uniref:exportin ellipsoid body open n=1 Tax=Lycorma delicatula TaxID=130591 RepID=UPI003F511083
MDVNEESLRTLESLLEQFFDDCTSNEKKQTIELTLASFTKQQGAWKQCLQFMNNSSNQYVSMFCLATLETIITKKWLTLMAEEKSQMTSLLYECCLDKHDKVPPFIRNKLLKLVVDIARYDWPHFYPNFLTNIISLIQSQNEKTVILGLLFLQTTSEELICPREDINVARKDELKCLLLAYIPQIFNLLIDLLQRLRGMTNVGEEIILTGLHAICHLFSWMSLENINSPNLLNLICDIATKMDSKGDQALSTINELLYKNWVPYSFLPSLISICCHGNLLLKAVLMKRDLDLEENSSYLLKLTEFVRLTISQHWNRLESSIHNFPIFDFLSNFFRYTFHLMTVDSMFYECLESWLSFVDYLHSKEAHHIERYNQVLVTLAQGILKKMQTVKDLDDETITEYGSYDTEYEKFINHCMELIAKIADIMPRKTCSMVLEVWHPSCTAYYQLLSSNAELPNELPVSLLDTVLTLTGTTRALGAMYENFHPNEQPAILSSLASIAAQATRANIHTKYQTRAIHLQLINLHVQFLDALKSWLNNSKTEDGLDEAVRACVPLLLEVDNQAPLLQKAAAFLLSGITALPRPIRLLTILEPLFVSALSHLAKNTWKIVQLALVRCVLFWNWDTTSSNRLELLKHVVKQMTPGGITDLKQIIWLLQNCQPDNKEPRRLLFLAVQPVLEQSVNEFPQLIETCPEIIEDVLKFFLESFRLFQDFIGVDFIFRAITVFLTAYQSADLKENSCGVEQLLELLTLIVEHPANTYKQFIPNCIELCLDQIYPHIADISSPQIKPAFFQLFKSILMHKWHYFYSGSLLGCEPVLEHKDRFCQILVTFGQSLTQTDIRVFAQNLHALESVNTKWKLYHKDLFRSAFLGEFLTVLMNNLVEKSHALLGDEIATAVYNMAAVDFNTYFNSFIPHFLSQVSGLDSYQREMLHQRTKPDTDLPSFIQNMHRLANDIRCYALCNGSVPSL